MLIDYDHIIRIVYPDQPSIFNDRQKLILNELIKYYEYYDGNGFKYIAEEFPEYKAKKDYKPAKVPVNYSRYIINKLASWQFEIPVDYNCTAKSENDADNIESDIYAMHKENLMDIKLLQAAVECNTSGGVVFKLKYDADEQRPKIYIRNRIECFPIYDFDDYENITKIHFAAFVDDSTVWKQTYELIDKVCYIEEATYDVKNNLEVKEQIIENQPLGINGKWLDFIPVYIIPNLPIIGEVWGISELKDLIPLINEIDKKYSDASDALKFEMFAITVFLNAKIPVDKDGKPTLATKAGSAWSITGGSPTDNIKTDVFKLQSTFQYADSLKYHIDSMASLIYELAEVVHLSTDKLTGIGNLSGVALKLLFASTLSKTNKKNTIWKTKIRDMWLGMLKMRSIYENYKYPDDLDIEVITHNPLPANEKEQVEIYTQKIAAGLASVETAMNELGIEDPEEELKKIIAEQLKYSEALKEERTTHGT